MDLLLILLTALFSMAVCYTDRRLWNPDWGLAGLFGVLLVVIPVMGFFSFLCIAAGYKAVTGVGVLDAPAYVQNTLVGVVLGMAVDVLRPHPGERRP